MANNLNKFLATEATGHIAMFFPTSCTYTVPYSGLYRLSVLGGGASGGAIYGLGAVATGGGGGSFAEKEVYLTVGDELTFVIGAGGAGVTSTVQNVGANGNNGGESSVHGSGSANATALNIHSGGGLAGLWTVTDATTVNGGLGGTATGGDINASGGRGGNGYNTEGNNKRATGGGAAGTPYGDGGRGGDITDGNGSDGVTTGGGGVGGNHGGDQTNNSSEHTCGGGSGGNASDNAGVAGCGRFGLPALKTISDLDGFRRILADSTPAATYSVIGFASLTDPFRSIGGVGGKLTEYPTMGGGSTGGTGLAVTRYAMFGGGGGLIAGGATGLYFAFGSGSGGTCYSDAANSSNGGSGIIAIERIG